MDDYDPNSILIEDAIKKIKKISKKINVYEYVDLIDSHNRVIYENIKSKLKVPNYDNSAMDGYALNIKDLDKTKIFSIKGSSLAGKPYKGVVKKKWVRENYDWCCFTKKLQYSYYERRNY